MKRSYQEIYDAINEDFSFLEQEVQNLEKAYYSIDEIYQAIDAKIDNVLDELKNKKTSQLSRRVARLKALLKTIRKERGYDLDTFSRLFNLVRKLSEKAPKEIFPDKLLGELKKRLEAEAKEKPVPTTSSFKIKQKSKKFLMVRNGQMHFLFEFKQKIWQNLVPNRDPLTLQIRNLKQAHIFFHLPGYELERQKPQKKLGILIEKIDGSRIGILVDAFEGTIFLSKKLLKKKIEYLKSDEFTFRPFIRLKGERYFLRD